MITVDDLHAAGSYRALASANGCSTSQVFRDVERDKRRILGQSDLKAERKRVVIIGDLHCGAKSGLTHPVWWYNIYPEMSYERLMWADTQREAWNNYTKWLKALQPIDVLVVNGDAIDGNGGRSGGTELLTPSLTEQAEIAAACIRESKAKKIYMTHGTPYHVSLDGEDVESMIASDVGAEIRDHLWLDVNGVVFDVKHKTGGSSIHHGRATAVTKEKVWNDLWAEVNGAPKADVFIRSHVHYSRVASDPTFLAMTLPALQVPLTKFGARQCSGVVHFGLAYFDVYEGDVHPLQRLDYKVLTAQIKSCAPKLEVV